MPTAVRRLLDGPATIAKADAPITPAPRESPYLLRNAVPEVPQTVAVVVARLTRPLRAAACAR